MTSEQPRYRAFLSYSSKDQPTAERLHKELESYRVPKQLVGRPTPHGPIPPGLFPIFRDRDELPSSPDLNAGIRDALERSDYLVVICSPHAVISTWVNNEIVAFKRMGRESQILAYVVDGEPNAAGRAGVDRELECFPTALKFKIGANGELTNEIVIPLAADPRATGDGKENAKLKIIAGLLGVGFDDLKQREREAVRRRATVRFAVSAAVALLAIAAVVGAGTAWRGAMATQREQSESILAGTAEYVPERAVPKLLEALPRSVRNPERPYLPEVASQLALSLDRSRDFLWLQPSSGPVTNLQFASNSPALLSSSASGEASIVDVWSLPRGAKILERSFASLFDSSISSDGHQIAVAERVSPSPLHLIRVSDAQSPPSDDRSLWLPGSKEQRSTTNAIAVAPDGSVVLAFGFTFGSNASGFARLDRTSGGVLEIQLSSCGNPQIHVSPEGSAAMVWCGDRVEIWQFEGHLRSSVLAGTVGEVHVGNRASFTRDGQYLAIDPNRDGNIVICRTSDGFVVGRHKLADNVALLFEFVGDSHTFLAITDDGYATSIDEDGTVTSTRITRAPNESGNEYVGISLYGAHMELARDGETILIAHHNPEVVDIRKWPSRQLISQTPSDPKSVVTTIVPGRSTSEFLVGRGDGSLEVWSGESAKIVRTMKFDSGPGQVILARNGARVLGQVGSSELCAVDLANDHAPTCATFQGQLQAVTFGSDPSAFLTLIDGKVEVRSFETTAAIGTMQPPDTDMTFTTASFDPTGRFLAAQVYSRGDEYSVVVIDLTDGSVKHRWSKLNASRAKLMFDPTGRYLIALYWDGGDEVSVFDLTEDRLLWHEGVKALSMAVDDRTLLVGEFVAGTLGFDLLTGARIPERDTKGQSIVAMSQDGRVIATRDNFSVAVRSSDYVRSLSRQSLGPLGAFGPMSMSSDGTLIALSANGTIQLRRSSDDRAPDLSYALGGKRVVTAALSDDGGSLITGDDDGEISLLDVAHQNLIVQMSCDCGRPVVVSVDSKGTHALVVGSDAAVALELPKLEIKKRTPFAGFSVTSANVSTDLNVAALEGARGGLRLLYPGEGRIDAIRPGGADLFETTAAWLSKDGRTLAYTNQESIHVVHLPSKEVLFEKKFTNFVIVAAAFDAQGDSLAVLQSDGRVCLIDVGNRTEEFTSQATFTDFLPNSIGFVGTHQTQLLLGSQGGPVWLASAKQPLAPVKQLAYPVGGLAFQSDLVASVGLTGILTSVSSYNINPNYLDEPGPIILWDMEAMTPLPVRLFNVFRPGAGSKLRVAVSRNGQRAFVFGTGPVAALISLEVLQPQALINEACRRVVMPIDRADIPPKLWIDKFSDLTHLALSSESGDDLRPATCPPGSNH
ncbi:toll/interleukin-1 receptor domain-containing protein [Methylocapsa sp. S129]|uniref:toll/interleukin-1 receptor domain-containing protein n=1 Tax=Methylocapsa sp. S129 TaxID=1641869 RepID=UPI00131EC1B4|nr:toll/interleukin-1 receptor domain-containing protein [Methylocapsa sp. S129]